MGDRLQRLHELVDALPEIYQPIYGYDGRLPRRVARESHDRLDAIQPVICALPGERLRLLDVGCAQGYFSLALSLDRQRPCIVDGIDYLDLNVAVCRELAAVHNADARFDVVNAGIDYFRALPHNGHDVVLLLNVLHHIAARDGFDVALACVEEIARKVDVAFIELASKDEPAAWADCLPHDPMSLLRPFAFVRELGRFRTHLSDVVRPLMMCSNRFAWVGRRHFVFLEARDHPHSLGKDAHGGTRRYYFAEGSLLKTATVSGSFAEHNRSEFERERDFLRTWRGSALDVPRLLDYEEAAEVVYLARETLPGTLLSDVLDMASPLQRADLLQLILARLVEFERHGLFHHDLRAWNILVESVEGPVHIIDFGALDADREPLDFDAFFSLVHEVVHGRLPTLLPSMIRSHRSPDDFPGPWDAIVAASNRMPPADLTFARIAELHAAATSAAGLSRNPVDGEGVLRSLEVRHNLSLDHFGSELVLYRQELERVQAQAFAERSAFVTSERASAASYACLLEAHASLERSLAASTVYARALESRIRDNDNLLRTLQLQDTATALSSANAATGLIDTTTPAIDYNQSLIETLAAKDEYSRALLARVADLESALTGLSRQLEETSAISSQRAALLSALDLEKLDTTGKLSAWRHDNATARRTLEAMVRDVMRLREELTASQRAADEHARTLARLRGIRLVRWIERLHGRRGR